MRKAFMRMPGPALPMILFMLVSCTKDPVPGFTYTPEVNPESGDTIQFLNSSAEAGSYDWDFGDGGQSSDEEPYHVYAEAGTYDVTLTASNDKKSGQISKTLVINDPTILDIMALGIRDADTTILPGMEVGIYDNREDALDFINVAPLYYDITDSDGIVVFNNVEPIIYYVILLKVEDEGYWYGGWELYPLQQNVINLVALPAEWSLWPDSSAVKGTGIREIDGTLKKIPGPEGIPTIRSR